MTPEPDIGALQATVVWLTFAITAALGALQSATRFCTMGALSDLFNIGDDTRLRMWIAAIGIAMIGTQGLAATGLIDPAHSIYTAPRLSWASHLIGGALFGFGMVLASGCGSRTLTRIGAGSLKALVVFIVMGLFATMTIKGVFAVIRVQWLDALALTLPGGQDLPRLLSDGSATGIGRLRMLLGSGIGIGLLTLALRASGMRRPDSLAGAIGVGAGIVAIWYLSGHIAYIAEDPDTLQARFLATQSGRMESLSFVGPGAHTLDLLMLWSDRSRAVTLGVASVAGTVAGACAWSIVTGSFRWEGFRDTEDTANHLIGAALMGIGGVTAMGCTFGQGLSGLSMLSLGAVLSVAGIVAGARLGFQWQAARA